MRYKTLNNSEMGGLRAAVLGANDGIVSIAGLVIGVAGAGQSKLAILTAGLAGIVAGAMSMAAGEYVSVCTQRDSEKSMLSHEKQELLDHPKQEFQDLVKAYEADGLSKSEATDVAKEMSKGNVFKVHADIDLHIDPKHLTNPWSSVFASAGSFVLGAIIPLIAVMIPIDGFDVPITFGAVIFALIITGTLSAKASGAKVSKSVLRVVLGGVIAMTITFVIGNIFHIAGV